MFSSELSVGVKNCGEQGRKTDPTVKCEFCSRGRRAGYREI